MRQEQYEDKDYERYFRLYGEEEVVAKREIAILYEE